MSGSPKELDKMIFRIGADGCGLVCFACDKNIYKCSVDFELSSARNIKTDDRIPKIYTNTDNIFKSIPDWLWLLDGKSNIVCPDCSYEYLYNAMLENTHCFKQELETSDFSRLQFEGNCVWIYVTGYGRIRAPTILFKEIFDRIQKEIIIKDIIE
jgi:hypothetical protein